MSCSLSSVQKNWPDPCLFYGVSLCVGIYCCDGHPAFEQAGDVLERFHGTESSKSYGYDLNLLVPIFKWPFFQLTNINTRHDQDLFLRVLFSIPDTRSKFRIWWGNKIKTNNIFYPLSREHVSELAFTVRLSLFGS
jgi:hypothetical protein